MNYNSTGAVVAGIGNGDALSGALGAGAAEAARPATADKDDATQQWASTIVGAIAGGGTGASTGLDGEKFNRQLHQREIAWIKANAGEFAKALYGDNPTPEQLADAQARLAQQALRGVDKGWSLKLGSKADADAKAFLDQNNANLFTVKDEYEFRDGSTDREHEISDLSKSEFEALSNFYRNNIDRATSSNPEGSIRIGLQELKTEREQAVDALGDITAEDIEKGILGIPQAVVEDIKNIPNTLNSAGNTIDATLPTATHDRLNELYGGESEGATLQRELGAGDVLSTMGMATGAGTIVKAGGKSALRALDGKVDEAFETPRLNPLDGTVESLDDKPIKAIVIDPNKCPESARHASEAQAQGHPAIITIDRGGASSNRRDSLRGIETRSGLDRDEYPPAIAREGGDGASVRHINSSDNRGAGACFGIQCRDISDGEKVLIETTPE